MHGRDALWHGHLVEYMCPMEAYAYIAFVGFLLSTGTMWLIFLLRGVQVTGSVSHLDDGIVMATAILSEGIADRL